ncbi:MAG: sensor histidine kinase [Aeromonas sp.]
MRKLGRQFHPRSLLTLVLTGYILVLLPLLMMIWHDYKTLSRFSVMVEDGSLRVLQDTRRAIELTSLSAEIERTLRRYAVLEQPNLLDRYQHQLDWYRKLLEEHREALPADAEYRALEEDLAWLEGLANLKSAKQNADSPRFIEIHRHSQDLEAATTAWVDDLVVEVKSRIGILQRELTWMSAMVAGLTLLLSLLFTYLIIHPVRQLENRILSLGAGGEPDRSRVEGPVELQVLGERLSWLHDRLQELEQQKYRFLRHVSHELKTPLACLREGADLLSEQIAGPLTADQKDICGMLTENSRRLQSLIERLLDFNRLSQQEAFERVPVPLGPVLAGLIDTYRLHLDAKQMQVVMPEEDFSVKGEPYRLGLILDNLFSNAVSYGAQGGTIWLRCRREGRQIVVEVANEGTPIPPADRHRIFEPFEQGSTRRQGLLKGSGIGLSVALESAHSLGGQLKLVDDSQADVCFRLKLEAC